MLRSHRSKQCHRYSPSCSVKSTAITHGDSKEIHHYSKGCCSGTSRTYSPSFAYRRRGDLFIPNIQCTSTSNEGRQKLREDPSASLQSRTLAPQAAAENENKEDDPFDLIEQLKKTHARITVLQLLDALHLTNKLSWKSYSGSTETSLRIVWVPSLLQPSNILTVFDKGLVEPKFRTTTLHVTMNINDHYVGGALVDTWATLNVLPLPILCLLKITEDKLQPASMMIAAHDQTKHRVHDKIILKVGCGPKIVPTNFCVVDTPASFELILSRLWIEEWKWSPLLDINAGNTFTKGNSSRSAETLSHKMSKPDLQMPSLQ